MGTRETIGTADEGERPAAADAVPAETVDLDEAVAPGEPPKHVRCRVGLHHWQTRRNDDGTTYQTCTICGEDEFHPPLFMGVDPHHR